MKRVILLVTALLVMGVQAQRVTGGHSHVINSDDAAAEFIYNGQYFETERLTLKKVEEVYEDQWVDAVCYKETTEYEKQCSYKEVTEQVCKSLPSTKECKLVNGKLKCTIIPGATVCHPETVVKWVCEMVPVIKTVDYPCKKKEPVLVSTVNKKFIANLRFRFDYNNLNPDMMIQSMLNEEGEVVVTAKNLYGSDVILLATKTVQKNVSNYFEVQNIDYQVTAFDQQLLLSHIATKPAEIEVTRNMIQFEVSKVQFSERARFVLRIEDVRSGQVLINRQLDANEYRMYNGYYKTSDVTKVIIQNLRGLGVYLNYNQQYKVRVISKVDIGEMEMLNSDVTKLQNGKTVNVRL